MKNISQIRKKIIKEYLAYHKEKQKNIDFFNSPYSYPATWSKNSGYFVLKSIYKKSTTEQIYQFIREIIGIGRLKSYSLFNQNLLNNNFENLYITWARKKDFDQSGNFRNDYMPKFTRSKNLWFLLNIDINKIKNKNYVIFQKKYFKDFSFYFWLKSVLGISLINKFNFKRIFYKLNVDTVFSNLIFVQIEKILKKNKIKKIFLPYEAQPFQKNLIFKIKKKYPNIKIIGYLNAVQPFPIHLHDVSNLPDVCYTISPSQKNQLTKIFGWKSNKIILTKSDKFRFTKKKNFKNKILLPYSVSNFKLIANSIEKLIMMKPNYYFSKFLVRPHPAGMIDYKYKDFVKQLKKLIKKFEYKFDSSGNKNFSIIIGSTSILLESLEKKIDVYHIVDQAELESLDNYLWPKVNIKQINDNIFYYSLKRSKTLINY